MKKIAIMSFLVLFSTLSFGTETSVKYNEEVVKVKGNFPKVGKTAPVVRVTEPNLSIKTIGGKSNRVQVLVTVPSIDTPICSAKSKKFDDEIKQFPNIDMTIVSMDLPYVDDRFCKGQGIKNISIASDFAYQEVGENYGVSVVNGELKGLLIRSIFIIDRNGRIIYQEIVPDINVELDYDKVMQTIKTADSVNK